MDIEKLLADEEHEKLTPPCPVSVWAEIFIDYLRKTKGKGIYLMTTKELHENYLNWVKDEEELHINLVSFGVRLTNLKIREITTKLTKTCSMRIFNLN